MNVVKILLAWFLGLMMLSVAYAQERGTSEEAKKMVEEALAHIKAVGPEKAFQDFSDLGNAKWHNKDVYLFCYKMDGTNVCHGANKALIGKNLIEIKTADGQFLIKNMSEMTAKSGGGWIEYKWPHPQTKQTEEKKAFVQKIPSYDGFLGAGIYR